MTFSPPPPASSDKTAPHASAPDILAPPRDAPLLDGDAAFSVLPPEAGAAPPSPDIPAIYQHLPRESASHAEQCANGPILARDGGRPSPERPPEYADAAPETADGAVPDPRALKEIPYLDPHYNETYCYLTPKDPESVFVIWEVGEGTRGELRQRFGPDFFSRRKLILRVCQVTGIDFNGFNAHSVFEVDDWLADKNEYWVRVRPDNDYIAEIGYRSHGQNDFEAVARSNSVFAPRGARTSVERHVNWAQTRVDANAVEVPVDHDAWRFNLYHYWKNRRHHAPEEKGYWALVLHQHLPFVHHPEYDVSLEEQWFFEAVTSVYTQLLSLFWRLERDKCDFRVTLSLTPSLMSMMQTPLLRKRAARHIDECIKLATRERDNSRGKPWIDAVEHALHRFWMAKEVFESYGGNLLQGYRDFQDMGKIEIIACPATHMILPLFKHLPGAVRAELKTAVRQYESVFGRRPRGLWLPENAFTPGIDQFLADEGIAWALINTHGILEGDTRSFYGTDAPIIAPSGVAFFGIDEETRASVWSREGGYPGHVNYKEWYRDLGYEADWSYLPDYFKTADVRRNTGLKYYRITRKGGALHEKDYYHPSWAEGTAHEQAGQFVYHRGSKATHALAATGRKSMVVSAYDAELFGHWWEEGPFWLESVFRKLLYDQREVRPVTPSEYLAEHPGHQQLMPGASSWGKKDYFQTWVDGRPYQPNTWVYRHMFRLSQKMSDLAGRCRDAADPLLVRALNQAGRELLLAIASDWGFLIETGQAVRYSELRITSHAGRARELMRQAETGRIDEKWLATLETADCPFPAAFDFRDFA